MGHFKNGKVMVMIDRGDYWQCAVVIPKNQFALIKEAGLASFRQSILKIVPFLADRVDELGDWSDIKLLTVKVDRLKRWYRDGVLCIGDASHAMSPIGGVGINLAIQDAVAAANILAEPLSSGRTATSDLAKVQQRRELPIRITQAVQVLIQNRILGRISLNEDEIPLPWAAKVLVFVLRHFPIFSRIPARVVGVGMRPEHIS
jgi:2-polyprenyl-6-methoxyphenol hydroxylase-like FAD-dependent oxidoreductase